MNDIPNESLVKGGHGPLIHTLNKIVVVGVKVLAVLMVLVIWLALIDVVIHLFEQLQAPFSGLFTVESLISTLGDFLAVLIAIEIFLNIIFYLQKDAIHVPLVLATALTAVARKVIIMEYKITDPHSTYSLAAVIFAVGITYWLVTKKNGEQL